MLTACCIIIACSGDQPNMPRGPAAVPLRVYAAWDEQRIRPVLDAYTAETGVNILLTTESGRALTDRLMAERHQATADLFVSDGARHLWVAVDDDLLRPTDSELLYKSIPQALRDPDRLWFALLVRGRVLAYDTRASVANDLTGYAGLADARWRQRLCLSSATKADNQTLVAMLIAEHGLRAAERIVRGWLANLALPVLADDAEVLQAIGDGRCSVGMVSSDRAGGFERDHADTPVALIWPSAASGGAYVDILGAGVTRHAGNPQAAVELLEWLASASGQQRLAGQNLAYPANPQVPADHSLAEWNSLPIRAVQIAGAGFYLEDAAKLMQRAGYGSRY